jgi:hypothetical protein
MDFITTKNTPVLHPGRQRAVLLFLNSAIVFPPGGDTLSKQVMAPSILTAATPGSAHVLHEEKRL